jgi:hypothetical protein
LLHLALHFLVPALLVGVLFRNQQLGDKVLGAKWQVAYLILIATMVVDIDHLLANPIYDPNRCSIGFHPLHQSGFIGLYILLCFIPKTRLIGLGLTIHMLLDSIDCQVTNGIWIN